MGFRKSWLLAAWLQTYVSLLLITQPQLHQRHPAQWLVYSNYSASTGYWIRPSVNRWKKYIIPLSEICFRKHVIRDPVSVLLPAPGHTKNHLPLRGGTDAATPWSGVSEQRIQGPPGHQNPPREGNLHLPPAPGWREWRVRQRLAGRRTERVSALVCIHILYGPVSHPRSRERKVYAEFLLKIFRSGCIPLSSKCEFISYYSQDTKIWGQQFQLIY